MQQRNIMLAMVIMTTLIVMMGFIGMGAWIIGRVDFWLGAMTWWWLLQLTWTRTALAFEYCLLWTMGCLVLVGVRVLPPESRRLAVNLTMIGVGSQALLGLLQVTPASGLTLLPVDWWLAYFDLPLIKQTYLDPIWVNDYGLLSGTIGNTAYLACIMAAFVPVAPWPVAAAFLVAIALAHGKMALAAALIGLAVQAERRVVKLAWVLGALVGFFGIAYVVDGTVVLGSQFFTSLELRWGIWSMTLEHDTMDWKNFVLGVGPSGWVDSVYCPPIRQMLGRVPCMQLLYQEGVTGFFTYAHNEWVQYLFEAGEVGFLMLLCWLASNWRMWTSPYRGSAAAILVMSAGWFIFHNTNMALPMIVLLGAATATQTESRVA